MTPVLGWAPSEVDSERDLSARGLFEEDGVLESVQDRREVSPFRAG